ncbi:hypothetical protein, partial [Thermincola ferriacetica]
FKPSLSSTPAICPPPGRNLLFHRGGLFLTLTQGRVGRVLRLPFGSDCARKTAAGQAEEFPHV